MRHDTIQLDDVGVLELAHHHCKAKTQTNRLQSSCDDQPYSQHAPVFLYSPPLIWIVLLSLLSSPSTRPHHHPLPSLSPPSSITTSSHHCHLSPSLPPLLCSLIPRHLHSQYRQFQNWSTMNGGQYSSHPAHTIYLPTTSTSSQSLPYKEKRLYIYCQELLHSLEAHKNMHTQTLAVDGQPSRTNRELDKTREGCAAAFMGTTLPHKEQVPSFNYFITSRL